MKELLERIGVAWCRARHNTKDGKPNISLPVNGKYVCWTCLRGFSTNAERPVPGTYVNGEVALG